MRLYKVQVGDTLYIYDDETKSLTDKKVKAGLLALEEVNWPNGWRQWICRHPICDITKEGSDQYTYDASGNRIKCGRTLVTRAPDGKLMKLALKPVWVGWDEAWS